MAALAGGALIGACGGDDGGSAPSVPKLSAAGERGRQVAQASGCVVCHTPTGVRSTGPTWKDLAGARVELDDGTTVTADEAYLRRAITDPGADVVDGYPPIMPKVRLDDREVDDLLAYLRDLSTTQR